MSKHTQAQLGQALAHQIYNRGGCRWPQALAPESPGEDKPMMAVGRQKVLQPSERLYVLTFRKGERCRKISVSQCYLLV